MLAKSRCKKCFMAYLITFFCINIFVQYFCCKFQFILPQQKQGTNGHGGSKNYSKIFFCVESQFMYYFALALPRETCQRPSKMKEM